MTGSELRAAREDLGYERRQDLADLIGVTRMALEHWEYGRRPIPQYVLRHLEVLRAVRGVIDRWRKKGSISRRDLEALEKSISLRGVS